MDSDDEVSSVTGLVLRLRQALVAEQRGLLQELSATRGSAPRPLRVDHPLVGQLRVQLRAEILAKHQLVSGQLDLALRNATVRHILERINAFEAAYGRGDGAFTTRWNVLSGPDLTTYETRLEQRLRGLLAETVARPDTSVERAVQGQIRELRLELEALRSEKASRAIAQPKLVTLAEAPTSRNVSTTLSNLEKAKSPKAAERALFVEVERRLVWSVDNKADVAALERLRNDILKGPNRRYFAALVRTGSVWRTGWPPRRGPPPGFSAPGLPPNPSPPGSGGGAAAVRSVSEGVRMEIQAIVSRDPIGRAAAAAQWRTAAAWLGDVNALGRTGWGAAVSTLSDADLKAAHERLAEWKADLYRATASQSRPIWWIEAEKTRIDQRLKTLASEIAIRGPPTPGPEYGPRGANAMQRAANASYANSRAALTFEQFQGANLERQRLVELERLLVTATQSERAVLSDAAAQQQTRARSVQGRRTTLALEALNSELKRTFINSRGPDSVVQADRMQAAKQILLAGNSAGHGFDVGKVNATLRHVSNLSRAVLSSHITIAATRVPLRGAEATLRFDSRFSLTDLNSAREFRLNPIRAPGGVIVDVTLPSAVEDRLKGVRYNISMRRLEVRLDDRWLAVSTDLHPEIVRAAYGFVLDQRVTAVDIGSYDNAVSRWLIQRRILDFSKLTSTERDDLLRARDVLQIVRINPALANTHIGAELIAADELIFQVVHLDRTLLASNTVFRGLQTRGLHSDLIADEAESGSLERGYKSILTVDEVALNERETALLLTPKLDFALYKEGSKFERVSAWFNAHANQLRERSPELRDLETFAIAVAVIRSAVERDVADDLDVLARVHLPDFPTPSLLCRSPLVADCERSLFALLTNFDSD